MIGPMLAGRARYALERRTVRDLDVLDSLQRMGRATVADLVDDTGRTRQSVLWALLSLERGGLAERADRVVRPRVRGRRPAVWRAL